jgi:hypothetical protein
MAKYDKRHGGAYDRGSADSYYRRGFRPHYFTGGTYMSKEVTGEQMTPAEIEAYRAGYEQNEMEGNFKDYS